ncbi:ribulokinase [Lentisphaera araneosa]|nr:ribulokinase [Lentisphaera araneosa]
MEYFSMGCESHESIQMGSPMPLGMEQITLNYSL